VGKEPRAFDQPALEAALQDYFHEVEHAGARIERLEKSLDEAIGKAPQQIRAVIEALQALRGVAQLTAAKMVSEIGSFSRFEPRKLMGYSGLVASEHSSGNRLRRGAITKTGNAHLRRVIVEAAWSYQRRPWIPVKTKAKQMAADGHTKRRILLRSMRYSLRAQSAPLVRGSSRRIMTLRFRPAYIRVINRRYLSTAATCFAFQKKTGWAFLYRGRSSPQNNPLKNCQT
jgi:transposase